MSEVLTHTASPIGEREGLLYGVVAEFSDAKPLLEAAQLAKERGYSKMDCFSPFPIHGLTDAMGHKEHKVPVMIFLGGCMGALIGLGLQYYTSAIDYPWNVGGRPYFSWQSFIPVTYECTILLAGLTAVFGTLAMCGFPQPYHPIFNTPNFLRASQDRFFLCIENRGGQDMDQAYAFLKSLNSENVSFVYADEEGNW